jgi:membrane-associated protease RseP (regulator of RpoE activity)
LYPLTVGFPGLPARKSWKAVIPMTQRDSIVQNNNWLVWMIVLFLGWSVAGGIAAVLVSQLGFPYTWISPLTLVMIGAVLFLVYRGYPIQAWLLAGCVGFIGISALAIARAVTVPEPNIPDVYRAEFDAANQSRGMFGFPTYGDYMGDYVIEYDANRDTYLIEPGYDTRTPVTVQFPPLETAGGQWAFESGSMRLSGRINATIEADPQQNWLSSNETNFEPDRPPRAAHPEMTVTIPLPYSPVGQALNATAALTIAYPAPDGTVQTTTLTRTFKLQIIGDEYYHYASIYSNWERSRSVIKTPLWVVLVVGSVLAGAAGVYLVREGALQPQPTSGLRMVIRRLSGSRQLGIEVHDLAQISSVTDKSQGVFVGRVTAQSPAGRAGFRTGDILIEFAGKPTNSPRAVNRLAKVRRGERVQAVVLRDGVRIELTVKF